MRAGDVRLEARVGRRGRRRAGDRVGAGPIASSRASTPRFVTGRLGPVQKLVFGGDVALRVGRGGRQAAGNTPATNASGLSTAAIDAQCNIATEFKLFYRTLTPVSVDHRRRRLLVRAARSVADDRDPDADDAGQLVPPAVRRRHDAGGLGRLDDDDRRRDRAVHRARRARHDQPRHLRHRRALRSDQAAGRRPAPQPQWNGKVVYSYGASTGQPRLQFRTEQNWADDTRSRAASWSSTTA